MFVVWGLLFVVWGLLFGVWFSNWVISMVKQFATAFLPAPQACVRGRPRKVRCYYWVLFRIAVMKLGQLRPDRNRDGRRYAIYRDGINSGLPFPKVIGDLPGSNLMPLNNHPLLHSSIYPKMPSFSLVWIYS